MYKMSIYPQRIKSRISNKYLYTYVHSNTVHNSQKLEATHISNKQNVVFPHNGILFSLKKEKDSDTSYNMNIENMILSKISKSQDKYCVIPAI